MITRTVYVDGKEMRMGASALIPRLYRHYFNRDMISDMNALQKAFKKANSISEDASEEEKQEAQLSALNLEIFENLAWIMLKHAGEDVANSPDEWLEGLDGIFSIYEVFPAIMELWNANNATTSVPRKK